MDLLFDLECKVLDDISIYVSDLKMKYFNNFLHEFF